MIPSDTSTARRQFLKLLAASPLLSYAGLPPGLEAILRPRGDRYAQALGFAQ